MDQAADSSDLSSNLQTLKIDPEEHDSYGYEKLQTTTEQDVKSNIDQHMETIRENGGSLVPSEIGGDLLPMFSQNTHDDFEQANRLTSHNFFLPPLSPGSPLSIPQMQGFLPYPFDGVQYPNNPVMDYQYLVPPVYGSLPSGIQYPIQGNNAYVYGSHVYQYPPQIAAYHPSLNGGQYIPSPEGLPVVMLDTQDLSQSGLIMTDGFGNGYQGSFLGFPTGILPEMGMIQGYPQPHSLRASAPSWVEPPIPQMDNTETTGHITSDQTNTSYRKTSKDVSSASTSVVPVTSTDGDRSGGAHEECEPVNKLIVPSDSRVSNVKGPLSSPPSKDTLNSGEQLNSSEFLTEYGDAKHFIIKSYSEDNVLKSIQYGVWASTPNGNKKLDEAYQDAQRRTATGLSSSCPVFLFFSVNGSRQFCGVAEMIGPVNHSRTMDFWELHKWSGSFPVKWHIIKDLPNSQLRRIILESNENKPVTNSRDTQEVPLQQGLEMLAIFKHYPARSSILDQIPWFSQKPVVPDAKPHHWPLQSFPRIREQFVRDEVIGSSPPKAASKVGSHTNATLKTTKSIPGSAIHSHQLSLLLQSSNDVEKKETRVGSSIAETKTVSESNIEAIDLIKENKIGGSEGAKDNNALGSGSGSGGNVPVPPSL